jgi:hypothetical protein
LGPYPDGPYGGQVGDVIRNLCFDAVWSNPKAADYDVEAMQPLCFSDLYDPAASRDVTLLLVNTAAAWCTSCRNEWGGAEGQPNLSDAIKARESDGLFGLGLMFQDEDAEPATEADVVQWASNYEIEVPFGLDDAFVMGAVADERLQPFNGVIDVRTMTIVVRIVGDQPGVLFERLDEELRARAVGRDAGSETP